MADLFPIPHCLAINVELGSGRTVGESGGHGDGAEEHVPGGKEVFPISNEVIAAVQRGEVIAARDEGGVSPE